MIVFVSCLRLVEFSLANAWNIKVKIEFQNFSSTISESIIGWTRNILIIYLENVGLYNHCGRFFINPLDNIIISERFEVTHLFLSKFVQDFEQTGSHLYLFYEIHYTIYKKLYLGTGIQKTNRTGAVHSSRTISKAISTKVDLHQS